MLPALHLLRRPVLIVALAGMIGVLFVSGCGSGGSTWEYLGSPFYYAPTGGPSGPGSTGQSRGDLLSQGDRTPVDPCTETQSRLFVRVSMRNLTSDYIHYLFVAIAFVDVDETDESVGIPFFDDAAFPNGAVCPDDIPLYTQFGYFEIPPGTWAEFGDYCVGGPALIYFHRNGQFRLSTGSGGTGLGSAIAPAQGTSPTYDGFFTSAGAQIPVPDIIIFHNPGGGEGAHLKISRQNTAPCDLVTSPGDPNCLRDAFYYVDDQDLMAGSTALGQGSGRRVPAEIQETGCQCKGISRAYQVLAPSRVTTRGAECNEFLRGGRIEYVFLRQDENPPFPQLVWKVMDSAGGTVHEFDSRAGLP